MDTNVEIEQLALPDALDSPGAGPFLAAAALANAVERECQGHDDFAATPLVQLVQGRDDAYTRHVLLVARRGGVLAGRATMSLPRRDNTHLANINVQVAPAHRRAGVGTALLERLQALAAGAQRSVLSGWSDHTLSGAGTGAAWDVVVPTTGSGRVPANSPAAGFARAHGFVLEQAEKISVLHLAQGAPAAAGHGTGGYELVSWGPHCPDGLLDPYAALRRSMSTEVPLGGLDAREEAWDGERVRIEEEAIARKGETVLVTVARHGATGRLAGHTVLEFNPAQPAVAFQNDTLVLPEHRGHGLGRRMKDANLAAAARDWPTVERIYTFNAEENTNMLAINIAMGFIRAGTAATWQKKLAAPHGAPIGES
ncbi:GNAT family N-acetyltransferase [Pseudarthrobacter sp. P1]|uniref:GNAT family N-acetyltransferase n=1 Tax=Pseudarthrobacter sp. P1 TaxID=3418418 RepID=UPI003CE95C16